MSFLVCTYGCGGRKPKGVVPLEKRHKTAYLVYTWQYSPPPPVDGVLFVRFSVCLFVCVGMFIGCLLLFFVNFSFGCIVVRLSLFVVLVVPGVDDGTEEDFRHGGHAEVGGTAFSVLYARSGVCVRQGFDPSLCTV